MKCYSFAHAPPGVSYLYIHNASTMRNLRRLAMALGLIMTGLAAYAQPSVTVNVSADTVRPGEIIEITYTVENGQGRLALPDMSGLPVVSGPNSSSSFIYQGGVTRSTQSYSFQLLAREEGKIEIPATKYTDKDQVLEIKGVTITVSANGAKSTSPSTSATPPPVQREKRKF